MQESRFKGTLHFRVRNLAHAPPQRIAEQQSLVDNGLSFVEPVAGEGYGFVGELSRRFGRFVFLSLCTFPARLRLPARVGCRRQRLAAGARPASPPVRQSVYDRALRVRQSELPPCSLHPAFSPCSRVSAGCGGWRHQDIPAYNRLNLRRSPLRRPGIDSYPSRVRR